jgi:hypothetical protein
MENDHNPLKKSSTLDSQQQRQRQKQRIVTTICPSGCGNGICPRVFEDSLGLGCKVYCVCDRPGCHKAASEEETKSTNF